MGLGVLADDEPSAQRGGPQLSVLHGQFTSSRASKLAGAVGNKSHWAIGHWAHTKDDTMNRGLRSREKTTNNSQFASSESGFRSIRVEIPGRAKVDSRRACHYTSALFLSAAPFLRTVGPHSTGILRITAPRQESTKTEDKGTQRQRWLQLIS